MRPTRFGIVPALPALLVTASVSFAQPPSIVHEPVACAVAEKFPRLTARFNPPDNVAVARLLFQGQTADWYSVAMKAEGSTFVGVLPKPRKDLKSFRYYIEVTDKALGVSRTTEFTTSIVPSSGACRGGLVSASVASASVVLQGPAGLAAIPGGFASTGVIAGSAAGSSAGTAGAASAAGAGGGIGATALVIGGVAVAGGAAVVAAKGGDDSGGGGSSSTRIQLNIAFLPLPGIDISVCGPGLNTFSSQGVSLNSSGGFDETWSPSTPNVVRANGTASPTSFQANLACTNGARSGTITASGSNYTMTGTFEFGPSRGQVSINRR